MRKIGTTFNSALVTRILIVASGLGLSALLAWCVSPAWGDYTVPTPPAPSAAGQTDLPPTRLPVTDTQAWPPPGQDIPRTTHGASHQNWIAQQSSATAGVSLAGAPAPIEKPARVIESTWYFRQEAFWWNERLDGADVVKEYGPLSTLGYMHRNGIERFRIEIFGGTMAYDGVAQFEDGTTEAYHDSCGTNYLGVRGEYDLLLEPPSWERVRLVAGIGTRLWVRDLRDSVTPSLRTVWGYQETWWTFYPYVGLETKEPEDMGLHFYGSMRVGITPLTYQHATYFDTTLYPRCGMTAQAQAGIRFHNCALAAYFECMTWGESAEVRDCFQPASQMYTVGGQFGFTF
jgi:hypothetical protein